MNTKFGILLLFSFIHLGLKAQNAPKLLREGNKLYVQEKFQEAFDKYKQSLEIDPVNQKTIYNQGNSLYKQEKWEEASQSFELSSQMMEDSKHKASAFHNLGNAYFKQEQYKKSVEAYTNALKLNPGDMDTKYNLMLAKKKLAEQQGNEGENQNNQDQNQDKNQDKNQNQEQENKDNQDKKEDEGDNKKDNQSGQNKDEKEKGEEQKPTPQPSKLSKEEVERILESLKNEENKVQQKLIYKEDDKSEKIKTEKDW
jgi:tetratricopeptide (TPR) repeat protein